MALTDFVEHRFGTERFKVAFDKDPEKYLKEGPSMKMMGHLPGNLKTRASVFLARVFVFCHFDIPADL